jgi:hypothetical protein
MRPARRRWRAALAAGLAWLLVNGAAAHTRSESLSVWSVQGSQVRVTVTLPEAEAQRLLQPAATPGAAAASPAHAGVADYLARHLGVSAAGSACPADGAPVDTAAARGFRRVELQWRCASERGLALHSSAFFERVPTHVMYARVQVGERFVEQVLTTDHRTLLLGDDGHASLQRAGLADYLALGLQHIVTGADHIAFLLGLVLVCARFRDLALVITGFTVGHSLTLALAVTGWLRPAPEAIDVLIALTIGLVGAENIAQAARRAGVVALGTGALLLAMAALRVAGAGRLPLAVLLGAALFAPCYLLLAARLHDAAPVRAIVTGVFGLVHGFAFANDLIEMRLPAGRLAGLLIGFNLGVELGQLLIVGALLAAAALLGRLKLALPRPPVVEAVSAALVGLSVFWITRRTYA